MTNNLNSRTKEGIRRLAKNLINLGNNDAPFTDIKKAANYFLQGHIEYTSHYIIDDLYRGQKWDETTLPTKVKRLLALPAEDIKKYGRLNNIGQSILYVSELPQTVFNELNLVNGDKVIILRLTKRSDAPSFYISQFGMLPQDKGFSNFSNKENEIVEMAGGEKNYKKLLVMRSCISKMFKKKIYDYNRHLYKITAALSHNHFLQGDIHGVMYPSVATDNKLVNLALKPSITKTHFKPHSVALIQIRNIEMDSHHVDTIKTGKVDGSENIIWDDSIPFETPYLDGMKFR